jgi:hypothetical protein
MYNNYIREHPPRGIHEDICFFRFQLLVTGAELNELNLLYRQLFTPITFHNLQKDNIKIGGEHISMHSHRSLEFLHCSRKKEEKPLLKFAADKPESSYSIVPRIWIVPLLSTIIVICTIIPRFLMLCSIGSLLSQTVIPPSSPPQILY